MPTPETLPRRRILRHAATDLPGAILLFLGIAVGVALAVTALQLLVSAIPGSGWESSARLGRWLALGFGVHLVWVYMPLYVTHGQTRREVLQQGAVVLLAGSGILALILTAGFPVEGAIYAALDWPHEPGRILLLDPGAALLARCAELWGLYLVGATTGAVVTAGFYRNGLLGVALIPLALGLMTIPEWAPVVSAAVSPGWGVVVSLTLLPSLLAWALTVALLRRVPIRNRGT